jgi:hypothetical protein
MQHSCLCCRTFVSTPTFGAWQGSMPYSEWAMKKQLQKLLMQFCDIPGVLEVLDVPVNFQFEIGPHSRPAPLHNERGVYLFFRNQEWLRVGQTGYSQRFTSQHYGTKRAGSSFSRDVWANRIAFGFEGDIEDVGQWIFQYTGRANIRIPAHANAASVGRLLEAFLHLHLKPRFEGRRELFTL